MLPVRWLTVMPHPVAAPIEADALRRLAEAMNRVHFPAPLLHLLLALLAFLTGNKAVMAQLILATASARTWRTEVARFLATAFRFR